MNWKDYIKSIQASGIVDGSLETIMTNLFDIAGCVYDPSLEAVKSWLSGRRNCKGSTYFPKGTINAEAVFRYFRKRPPDRLHSLQAIFKNQIAPDADSPIDVKTKDLDLFCWSLVNQFLDLIKFERVDIPQPKDDTSDIGKDPFPYSKKCCVYCIHWDGNRNVVDSSRIPTEGICCTHTGNRRHFSLRLSSAAACTNYEADQTLMNWMKELGYNIEDFI